jgi:hypothetical protein
MVPVSCHPTIDSRLCEASSATVLHFSLIPSLAPSPFFARHCLFTQLRPRSQRTPPRVLSLDDVVPNPACFNFPTQFIRMFDAVWVLFRISRPSDLDYHVNERTTWYHAYSDCLPVSSAKTISILIECLEPGRYT